MKLKSKISPHFTEIITLVFIYLIKVKILFVEIEHILEKIELGDWLKLKMIPIK
jgi:hypothetical protein